MQTAMDWAGGHLNKPGQLFRRAIAHQQSHVAQSVLEGTGTKTIHYFYDFGDGWDHVIRVERILDATLGMPYPRLPKTIGACPPEDVAGPWG